MSKKPLVTDAEFEVVSGPFRVGDEHPTQKGWYYTDKIGRHGERLWYKPPGPISRWVRRVALFMYLGMMGMAFVGIFLAEGCS